MANRGIQQKIVKMKRRNRHAVFSGATTQHLHHRSVEKLDPVLMPDGSIDEDKVRIKRISIPVGPISLSKAVINTGRGPDAVRMQEYYQRVHSYDEALPDTIGGSVPIDKVLSASRTEGGLWLKVLENTYTNFIKGVPKECHINYLKDHEARIDLFFAGTQWFWVEINYKKKFARRSKIYPNKQMAELMLEMDKITWVEVI